MSRARPSWLRARTKLCSLRLANFCHSSQNSCHLARLRQSASKVPAQCAKSPAANSPVQPTSATGRPSRNSHPLQRDRSQGQRRGRIVLGAAVAPRAHRVAEFNIQSAVGQRVQVQNNGRLVAVEKQIAHFQIAVNDALRQQGQGAPVLPALAQFTHIVRNIGDALVLRVAATARRRLAKCRSVLCAPGRVKAN